MKPSDVEPVVEVLLHGCQTWLGRAVDFLQVFEIVVLNDLGFCSHGETRWALLPILAQFALGRSGRRFYLQHGCTLGRQLVRQGSGRGRRGMCDFQGGPLDWLALLGRLWSMWLGIACLFSIVRWRLVRSCRRLLRKSHLGSWHRGRSCMWRHGIVSLCIRRHGPSSLSICRSRRGWPYCLSGFHSTGLMSLCKVGPKVRCHIVRRGGRGLRPCRIKESQAVSSTSIRG